MRRITLPRLAELCLLLLLALVILWKGGKSVDAVWMLALAGGFLGLLHAFDRSPTPHLSPWVFWPAVLFTLWTAVSYLTSSTQNYGLDEVLQTAALILIFFRLASHSREHLHTDTARTISFATLLASGLGVAVYILQPVTRFVGSFFDFRFHTDYWPNAWAEFLLLAWPMLLFVLFLSPSHAKKSAWLRPLILGFVIAAGLLSYSRGAVLSFLVQAMFLVGLFLWKKRRSIHWKPLLVSILSSAVAAVLFFVGINGVRQQYHPIESVTAKISFKAAEGKTSVSERSAFWLEALELAEDHPLLGYGPYSFRFVQPEVQSGVLATSDHPHNVFLKLAMERGVPAALLFSWILFMIFLNFLRHRTSDWFSILAMTSVVGVMLHNLIDYNLQFVGIALPLWMLLGFLAPTESHERSQPMVRRSVVFILSAGLLVLTCSEGIGLYRSSFARHSLTNGDTQAAADAFEKTEWVLFSRDDWLTRSIISLEKGEYLRAEAEAQRYIVLNEEDARGFRLLGDIYRAWGQNEEALRAYEKAFARSSRNDLGIARGYAELLIPDRQKLTGLRPTFDLLLAEFTDAILVNAHFVALSKNVEELDALTRLLSRTYPEDRGIYESMRRRAVDHAEEERERYRARPRGLLW